MPTADRTFTFTVSAPASSTLESAAAALSSGQSAQFNGGALSLTVGGGQSYAHWSMLFHYDPTRKEFHFMGKGQDGDSMHHLIYSEANGYRVVRIWGAGTTGHPYCAHTLDPATGDFYFFAWGNLFAQRYQRSTDSWISNTATATGNWGTAPNAVCAWHPNLFGSGDGGIVVLTRQLPVRVFFWRKATNVWTSASASSFITVNTKEGGAAYSPALDAVVAGGGDNGNLNMIRVNPGPTIQGIAAAPVAAGDHSTRNPLTAHPVSGKPLLIEQTSTSDRYWVYESATNTWDATGTHPFNDVPSTANPKPYIVCPVAAYGVVASLKVTSSAQQCRWDNWKP